MKKNILIGIFSPLFFFLVENIMLYTIVTNEYSEKYVAFHMTLLLLLPALPGIALIFLLIRNSIKEYFKSLGVCFIISSVIYLTYMGLQIDLMIYTKVTGYEKFSMGEGLFREVILLSYFVSSFVGSLFSGVITFIKKQANLKGSQGDSSAV